MVGGILLFVLQCRFQVSGKLVNLVGSEATRHPLEGMSLFGGLVKVASGNGRADRGRGVTMGSHELHNQLPIKLRIAEEHRKPFGYGKAGEVVRHTRE